MDTGNARLIEPDKVPMTEELSKLIDAAAKGIADAQDE
jgi:hypothetical protein